MDTKIGTPPLVIVGLDAGDPERLLQWAAEGHLPTIASLMERGCWGRTAGADLVSEHGVWVSVFSGVSRSEHGYYYLRQLKPGTYDLKSVTGPEVDARPFWSNLRSDTRVAIVDVPDGPLMAGLRGFQVANWATHKSWDPVHYPPATEPVALLQELRQRFGERPRVVENHRATLVQDRQIHRDLLKSVAHKGELCRSLLARDSFDLTVIVFGESHTANHQFWQYRTDGTVNAEKSSGELADATRDVYRAIDAEIGALLAQLPREANVVVVSSVGMEDRYPTTGLIDAFCRQLGYQAAPAPAAVSLRPLDLVRRFVPARWRSALSRHLSREQGERLLADHFRTSTDWSRTTAFAIPSSYTSFVRVNVREREPQGIVEPGAEYEAVLDRLEADLQQLVDAETGELAVTQLTRTVRAFRCDLPSSLPDLFVEWKPGRFMRRVLHPRAELVQGKPDFYRVSDHSKNGFVAAAGPSIGPRGALAETEVLDLAPTFLALLGEPVPDAMEGRVAETFVRRSAASASPNAAGIGR
jgi:predicted AlkP superfamily phosphohydrolase/phosphomutase